ncbi:MAG: cyclic nucleotide-binding protein [Deltaproteobacteria bacterium HGW-Deltaproteobacteria-8]|jgi:hemerythrin|nr:MAG: cyclic nucleotide-binding protein [Deltaproteobacteria bacterium HGW-Deltaproteobacteria-8]
MGKISKIKVAEGIYYVSIQDAGVNILCGCPADSVKHLMKRGLIQNVEAEGVSFETGPNAILLTDERIQQGRFANLSEFPILQIFYRQGRIIPGHPNNTGVKPALIGSRKQVEAQMEYIYRGNYGLVSEEEMMAAGVSEAEAKTWMRLKLKFAFGKIRRMEEYLDLVVVENEPQEIRSQVFVKRLKLNQFEISYGKESVRVDLNPTPQTTCKPSYVLGFHHIKRDYFAVLHSGEGDGWDPNRPAMASIVIFQGKVYLIDAGPNIMHSLNALGISINEISGIFHTHAHDDHFCGLPALMRSDHRIPYYATKPVRASVMKKLAALAMTGEEEFNHYFEFHDLELGQWNDIDTLEVKPVFSPHPVETTVMLFRTLDRNGYRTYAHFADIASLGLLRKMITADPEAPGLSQELYDEVCANYLEPVDLKKLDIGGGMIHGDAEDFASDKSGKILLAHTALPLTNRQKEIGSGAPFGMVDVLIPAHQDYIRSYAYHYLSSYFPTVSDSKLRVLLNCPVVKINPETLILKAGRKAECVHLILTGQVEVIRTKTGVYSTLTTGGLLGEYTALMGKASLETYRAANFVQALRIPLDLYATFVKNNALFDEMIRLQDIRSFLYTSSLFGDGLTCTRQNAIAEAVSIHAKASGETLTHCKEPMLCLVKSGKIELLVGDRLIETLGPGEFFNESTVLFETPCLFKARAAKDSTLYIIPGAVLAEIPIVRWKLLELYEKRLDKTINQGNDQGFFQWQDEYAINVERIDAQHMELYSIAKMLYAALFNGQEANDPALLFPRLISHTRLHFQTENQLMLETAYPGFAVHAKKHEQILRALDGFSAGYSARRKPPKKEVGIFLKDWVMTHILTEDRRLGTYLNMKKPR